MPDRPRSERRTQNRVGALHDGRQSLTSLYGVVRGKPPKFFDGNTRRERHIFLQI